MRAWTIATHEAGHAVCASALDLWGPHGRVSIDLDNGNGWCELTRGAQFVLFDERSRIARAVVAFAGPCTNAALQRMALTNAFIGFGVQDYKDALHCLQAKLASERDLTAHEDAIVRATSRAVRKHLAVIERVAGVLVVERSLEAGDVVEIIGSESLCGFDEAVKRCLAGLSGAEVAALGSGKESES